MPSEGYVAIENGLRLHYEIVGGGPNSVVIPGGHSLAADLHPLAEGRRLVFYDQRGRGRSDADPDGARVWSEYEVADLEAVRAHLGLERISLVGWSYTGGVVVLYAARYPARVDRLVLMCAIAPRSDAPYEDPEAVAEKETERIGPEGARRLKEMEAQGLDASDPETYCREFWRVIVPRQMGNGAALSRMRSDPCAYPNEWPCNKAKHIRLHFPAASRIRDWRKEAKVVEVPALVVHGLEDLIPLEASREWASTFPNARLLPIPGSGHYPHLEAPEVFFPALGCFLNGEWPEGAEAHSWEQD